MPRDPAGQFERARTDPFDEIALRAIGWVDQFSPGADTSETRLPERFRVVVAAMDALGHRVPRRSGDCDRCDHTTPWLIVIALVLIAGTLCLAYWQAMPTGTTTGYWTFGAVGWACLDMLLLAAVAIGARTRRRLVVA